MSLVFSVHYTGIGIAPDKQETIFRAFEQEDASTTPTVAIAPKRPTTDREK